MLQKSRIAPGPLPGWGRRRRACAAPLSLPGRLGAFFFACPKGFPARGPGSHEKQVQGGICSCKRRSKTGEQTRADRRGELLRILPDPA